MENNDLLAKLKYHNKWYEYNFIDDEHLSKQIKEYSESDDKNTEHYRYKSFLRILENNKYLTDQQITQYIELVIVDNDKTMGISAIIKLIDWKGLNINQNNIIMDFINANDQNLYNSIEGILLKRKNKSLNFKNK